MKTKYLLAIAALLLLGLNACHTDQPDYCTVKGTVKGLNDGTKLELTDSFDQYEVVGKGKVENGTFVIHPAITSPTHAYLYIKDGYQLKDFILEPGTILVDVDASDEEDDATGAKGTASNDLLYQYRSLLKAGDEDAAQTLRKEIFANDTVGALSLLLADYCKSSAEGLAVLDKLPAAMNAKSDHINKLKDELTRRLKTEPKLDGSDVIPLYIDMEYPDAEDHLVSLNSVVNDPDNRFVLVDFWATWCGSCMEGLPRLKETYQKYHERGLEIYGISVDQNRETWKECVEKNDMTWVNVCDASGGRRNSKAWHDYALRGIPTMVLIDGETGEIIDRGHLEDFDFDALSWQE